MTAKKILIADFEGESLNSLANLLQTEGFQIATATDGLAGLEKFVTERPDLIILEAFLPKIPGLDLCYKIIHEFDMNVPVIIITEFLHGTKCKNEACQLYGAAAFFEKPVQREELVFTIFNLLEAGVGKKIKEEKPEAASILKASSEKYIFEEMNFLEEIFGKEAKKDQFREMPLEIKTEIIEKKGKKIVSDSGENIQRKDGTRIEEGKEPLPRIGDYVLLERLGSGGMGEVYKSAKRGLGGFEKTVAIKRIHPYLAEENKEFINMFIDEAKLVAQLSHPNVVQIYDFAKDENYYFIVMEYVKGENLSAILYKLNKQGKIMPFQYLAFIGIRICQALDYAHQKCDASGKPLSIVHRDVCPKNILVSFEGEVKLADFGVAKAASKIHHTIPGSIKGKIPYMSPQQACGEEIDHRSDIFSLGCVLYEMVTGEKLFSEESDIALLNKVQKGIVSSPSQKNPDVPKEMENIILKALQYDPEKRHQNVIELKEDLERFEKKYKENIATYNEVAQFMIGLFADEIEEKGLMRAPEEQKAIKEKSFMPAFASGQATSSPEEKRINILYKLMLADDSPIVQKIVSLAFSKENLEIYSSLDGQKVLDTIEKVNPDVILLDINLPKRNGYEICEVIMNNSKLSNTIVILLKEPFEKINYKRLENLYYEEILQKPLDSRKLVQKVKKLIEKRENLKTTNPEQL